MAFSSSSGIPFGIICAWSGTVNNIPSGWALCNGQNNTPNLSGRFILGYGGTHTTLKETGGAETVQLTASQMPSHNHSATARITGATTTSGGAHTHNMTFGSNYAGGSSYVPVGPLYTPYSSDDGDGGTRSFSTNSGGGAHTHDVSITSSSITAGNKGGGQAHNNMPPYYVLAFIMKL